MKFHLPAAALGSVAAGALMLAAASPADARELNWTASADSLTLDPHAQNEGPTHTVSHQIYDSLIWRDNDLELTPGLATDWYVHEDNKNVWVFELRQGVKFHQGQDFTAEDVVFSIERAMHENSDMRGLLTSVVDVRAVGSHKVEIETDGPNPILPNNLTNLFMMDSGWAAEHDVETPQNFSQGEENYAVRNANGTGPFELVERVQDTRTVFERNDDWWGMDTYPMEITRMVFEPIESASTRVAALLSGEIDLMLDAPVQDIQRLRSTDGVKVDQAPQNRTIFLGMHQGRDELLNSDADGNPMADKRVRRAMYHAINAQAIKRSVMRGNSQAAGMVAPPFVNGYTEELDERLAYDPEQARKLLDEAGYPEGFEVTLHCPNDRYINDEEICEAVTGLLGRVGIEVNLVAQPKSVHFAELQNGKHDFYMLGWGVPTLDSEYIFNFLFHSNTGSRGSWNQTGYSNDRVDELTQGMAAEIDIEKRNEMIAEAWNIVQDDVVYLPLHHQVLSWAMNDNIDFPVHSENTPLFWTLEYTD